MSWETRRRVGATALLFEADVTDREAMLALAASEPDYPDAPAAWQTWHDERLEALEHAQQARYRLAGVMVSEHRLQLVTRCPADPSVRDVYDVTVTVVDRVLPVEQILDVVTLLQNGPPIYQEDATGRLAATLDATVETVGAHSGVVTAVRVEG